jgi:hypothetical protein
MSNKTKTTMPIEFSRALAGLALTIQAEYHECQAEVYWRALCDVPLPAIVAAITGLAKTLTNAYGRLPLPGSIREYALALAHGGNPRARADVAWAAVLQAVSRYGSGRTVDFDDRAINAAVNSVGGWQELCRSSAERLEWRQRSFAKAYVDYCRDGFPQELGTPLGGYLGLRAVPVETGLEPTKPVAIEHPAYTPKEVRQLIAAATPEVSR